MNFGWSLSKYTVANLQVHQRLFYHPRLSFWQFLGLWISLSGSSACATTVTAKIPVSSVNLIEPGARQQSQSLLIDTNWETPLDSVSLDVSLSSPTVETEILWSEGAVSSVAGAGNPVSTTSLYLVSQLNEPPEQPSEVELQLQQDRNLEQVLTDPELGNLRLQKPGDRSQEDLAEPTESTKPNSKDSNASSSEADQLSSDPELGKLRLRSSEADQLSSDPELGELRLRSAESDSLASDPELGELRLRESIGNSQQQLDPELGNLRLRQQPVRASRPQRTVYLQGRVDFFQSDNIFSSVDPIDDSLIRTGLSLWAAPAIGPKTYLIGSVNGNLIKYSNQDDFDYNEVRVGVSVYQQLTPKMYGEVGLSNQQLFTAGGGDRFLSDTSIRLGLGRRDSVGKAITLDSFYQLRYSLADPSDRSRIVNALGASLNYNVTTKLQTGLDYQYVLSSFTEQGREDNYHQLLARVSYDWSRNSRITVFGGFGFGNSSNRNVDFDSSILGVSLSVNLPLF